MAELPPGETDDEFPAESDDGTATGTPRWVKAFGIVALLLIVLVVFLIFVGGHGPGRHVQRYTDGHPLSSVTEPGAWRQ